MMRFATRLFLVFSINLIICGGLFSQSNCEALDAQILVVGYSELNPAISGQAPMVVNVDALSSCVGQGTILTARYLWDFGDPAGAHNTIEGWGGGHVYDTPGSYTLTLTMTNEAREVDIQTISVTVTEDTKQNIFVANSGSDTNDGTSEANAIQTIPRLMEILTSNQKLNFHAGDTFEFTEANRILIDNLSNITIGKYGEGADPMFLAPPQGESGQGGMVEIYNASTQIVVENIYFTGPDTLRGLNPAALSAVTTGSNGVTNIAVRSNYFGHVTNGVNTGAANEPARGIYLADNEAGYLGLYLMYGSGSNHTVIGNSMLHSVDAHSVRFYADRMFVYENDLASHDNSTSISAAGGIYAYIRGNTVRHPMRVSYLAVDGPSIYTDVVFEGNRFIREPGLTDYYVPSLWIFPNSRNIMVRNNIFLEQNTISVRLGGDDVGGLDSVFVLNNTSLSGSDNAGFTEAFVPAVRSGGEVVVANNLVVHPNFMGGRYNGDSNPFMNNLAGDLTGYVFSNNVWQESQTGTAGASGNPHRVNQLSISVMEWDAFSQTTDETYANLQLSDVGAPDYRPPAGSIPDGHAIYIPGVLADFHGNSRPETNLTAGAVEIGTTVDIAHHNGQIPSSHVLYQNYPNPFNPSTKIFYELHESGFVNLKVYDILGREVATLVDGYQPANSYGINFDAGAIASGVYIYRLHVANKLVGSGKMLLLR